MVNNEYRLQYLEIIEYAKQQNRKKRTSEYYEDHHIIPASLGGSDKKYNMVLLTAEEHWEVHTLLPFFTEGEDRESMIFAWNRMANSKCYKYDDASKYQRLRKLHAGAASKLMSETMSGMVNAKDKLTGEAQHVTLEEFESNNNLVGAMSGKNIDKMSETMSGMVSAKDKLTGETIHVSKEEFELDDNLVGVLSGTIGHSKGKTKYTNSGILATSKALSGKPKTTQHKDNLIEGRLKYFADGGKNSTLGRRRMNDGIKGWFAKDEEISTFLIAGCKLGGLKKNE